MAVCLLLMAFLALIVVLTAAAVIARATDGTHLANITLIVMMQVLQ